MATEVVKPLVSQWETRSRISHGLPCATSMVKDSTTPSSFLRRVQAARGMVCQNEGLEEVERPGGSSRRGMITRQEHLVRRSGSWEKQGL